MVESKASLDDMRPFVNMKKHSAASDAIYSTIHMSPFKYTLTRAIKLPRYSLSIAASGYVIVSALALLVWGEHPFLLLLLPMIVVLTLISGSSTWALTEAFPPSLGHPTPLGWFVFSLITIILAYSWDMRFRR